MAETTAKTKRPRIGEVRGTKVEDPLLKKQSNTKKENANIPSGPKVDSSVWKILMPLMMKDKQREAVDYLNSPYKNDIERIKVNTLKYRNKSIAEAFDAEYNLGLDKYSEENLQRINETPAEIRVGSIVRLKIKSVSKEFGVMFNSGNYKDNFSTRNNLQSYSKLLDFTPNNPLPARVLEKKSDRVMVDLLGPMIEEFVLPRAQQPYIQNRVDLSEVQTVKVKDLKLVRGGYVGQAVIPNVSDFLGEEYTVDAFIPGSQIVLNTAQSFEAWEGKDVDTFITAYGPKPGNRGMSLVCSRKMYLKYLGVQELMKIHKLWCDKGQEWDDFSTTPLQGVITGVINSAKKCGVFVEIPEYNITGLIPMKAEDLTSYHAGDPLYVNICDFDEDLVYNAGVDQYQHPDPFEIEDGYIRRMNVKPVLRIATETK